MKNFSQFKSLTSSNVSNTFDNVITKLMTEPENSKKLSLANTSTPLNNRAFFVRGLHTPKENNQIKTGFVVFLSNEFNQTNFGTR